MVTSEDVAWPLTTRLSALRPPSWGPVKNLGNTRGANKKRSARTLVLVIASQRTRAKSRGPMTGSAKQSRGACDDCEAALDCFGPLDLAMTTQRENEIYFHLSPHAGKGSSDNLLSPPARPI